MMNKYLTNVKKELKVLYIFILLVKVIDVISLIYSKIYLDEIMQSGNIKIILRYAVSILMLYVVGSIISIQTKKYNTKCISVLDYKLKEDFFDKIQKSPYLVTINNDSTDIYFRMVTDLALLSNYFFRLVLELPISIISIVAFVYIMWSWSRVLFIYILVMSVVHIIISIIIKKPIRKSKERLINSQNIFAKEISNHFRGIETVKIYGLEEKRTERLSNIIEQVIKKTVSNTYLMAILNFASGFFGQLTSVGLLILGGMLIHTKNISFGEFIGFYMLLGHFSRQINIAISFLFTYEEVKVSYLRYTEFIKEYDDDELFGGSKFKLDTELRLSNLSFSYNSKREILKNTNACFEVSNVIGIVGRSGAGKSTLAKIISRLIKHSNGNIYIDGVKIECINYADYKKNLVYISQTPYIEEGSIRDNLLLGINENDFDEDFYLHIVQSIKVDDIIHKLPDGENTKIGIGGIHLSNGESQRITIARALMKKPKIIILDEPTSALNYEHEVEIIEYLKEFAIKTRALVLIISHKESTLKFSDSIYELEDGKLTKKRKS